MPMASIIPRDRGQFLFRAMLSGLQVDDSGEGDGVLHVTYRDAAKVLFVIREVGGELLCVEDEIPLSKEEMFVS